MDSTTPITLPYLIQEGKEIRGMISFVPSPRGVWRTFSVYSIADIPKYETWKNLAVRFLSANYPEDRCIADFENKVKEFSDSNYDPTYFDGLIGILESCNAIPILPKAQSKASIDKSVHVNVTQTQSQSQEQSFAIDIFLEAIKDEIKGKQLKELKLLHKKSQIRKKPKPRFWTKSQVGEVMYLLM